MPRTCAWIKAVVPITTDVTSDYSAITTYETEEENLGIFLGVFGSVVFFLCVLSFFMCVSVYRKWKAPGHVLASVSTPITIQRIIPRVDNTGGNFPSNQIQASLLVPAAPAGTQRDDQSSADSGYIFPYPSIKDDPPSYQEAMSMQRIPNPELKKYL